MPRPTTLTQYYSPNTSWDDQFLEISAPGAWPPVSWVEQIDPRSFTLGRTTTVRWNVGVYGAAPAGKRFTIPVYVQRNGSDTVGKVGAPAIIRAYALT